MAAVSSCRLPFLAVGRVADGATLAHYDTTGVEETRLRNLEVFRKVLVAASSKIAAGQCHRLQWRDGSVCCFRDSHGTYLYCVMTSVVTFPEKLAQQLLNELAVCASVALEAEGQRAEGLEAALRPRMEELLRCYEDTKYLLPAMDISQCSHEEEVPKSPQTDTRSALLAPAAPQRSPVDGLLEPSPGLVLACRSNFGTVSDLGVLIIALFSPLLGSFFRAVCPSHVQVRPARKRDASKLRRPPLVLRPLSPWASVYVARRGGS